MKYRHVLHTDDGEIDLSYDDGSLVIQTEQAGNILILTDETWTALWLALSDLRKEILESRKDASNG